MHFISEYRNVVRKKLFSRVLFLRDVVYQE